jgi:hypothetical protein
MAKTTTNATTKATTNESNTKRVPPFQVGLEKFRDPKVLAACNGLVTDMATREASGFDMLYINMPWKSISMDYAATLPVANLVKNNTHAGVLLWVDSPCIAKANTLLDAWGFKFHSVMHVTSYVNPAPSVAPAPAAAAVEAVAEAAEGADEMDATTTTTTTTTDQNQNVVKAAAPRKGLVPHGWTVDGIVPSRSRQLWFAVRNTAADDVTTPYLKDASFIRKRLQATSTFEYSKSTEGTSTTLSSKKKNLDSWLLFPEYDAYVPAELRQALETIHRPNARVLSMFSDSVNRNWYTWGPNVPGYVSGPLRQDGGFPIVNALLKYFSSMKGATVQKYLTLMNLYAVQSAKQMGNEEVHTVELDEDGKPREYLTPLVMGRMQDFFEDLVRKYTESGGIVECDMAAYSPVSLAGLSGFREMTPEMQAQILLLVGQVIRSVLQKNADATERRKKAVKRKRELNGAEEEGEPKPRIPRKFGIAAPVDISKDLADFMGLAAGEKVARTTVVKFVNEYIGAHNLQNPEKKSEIKFDETLQGLFNPGPSFGPVTYFNLWKLLGPHFISKKKASSLPPSSAGSLPPARQPLMPTQGSA